MTVKSTYWYAIATLCDWFKNLGPVFQSTLACVPSLGDHVTILSHT